MNAVLFLFPQGARANFSSQKTAVTDDIVKWLMGTYLKSFTNQIDMKSPLYLKGAKVHSSLYFDYDQIPMTDEPVQKEYAKHIVVSISP